MRTIGEVATALGIRQHVLRYWEEQFPMLRPLKRSGGRRYYRADDIALLMQINRLVHDEGYTLRGARAMLEGGGGVVVPSSVEPTLAVQTGGLATVASSDIVVRLGALRARLAAALD